jgi:hypothetical protein
LQRAASRSARGCPHGAAPRGRRQAAAGCGRARCARPAASAGRERRSRRPRVR